MARAALVDPVAPAFPVARAVRVDRAAPAVRVDPAARATGTADVAQAVMSPVAPVVMVLEGQVNRVVLADRADQASQVGTNRAARVLNPEPALLDLMPTAPDRAPPDPIPADPDPDPMQARQDRMPAADRRWEPTVRAAAIRREARTRPADRTHRLEVTPQAGATLPAQAADPKPLSTQVRALAKARSLPSRVQVRAQLIESTTSQIENGCTAGGLTTGALGTLGR